MARLVIVVSDRCVAKRASAINEVQQVPCRKEHNSTPLCDSRLVLVRYVHYIVLYLSLVYEVFMRTVLWRCPQHARDLPDPSPSYSRTWCAPERASTSGPFSRQLWRAADKFQLFTCKSAYSCCTSNCSSLGAALCSFIVSRHE